MKTRRQPPPVPVAVLTYAQLQTRVVELEKQLAQVFTVREMRLLRDTLLERAARAEATKDTLKWQLRQALQRVRQTEQRIAMIAGEMRSATSELEGALDSDRTKVRPRHLAVV